MYCPNCGKEIKNENSKFCKYCGCFLQNNKRQELLEDKIETISEKNSINEEISFVDSQNYNENKIETDFFDNLSGIKKGNYEKIDLSKQRFKMACNFLYMLSLLSIIIGAFLFFSQENNSISNILNKNEIMLGGILYLFFTFIFYKLKMPIMILILALIMLIDKLYMIMLSHKIGAMVIFIILGLSIVILQSIRVSNYIKSDDKKILKYLASILFFLVILLSIIGIIKPDFLEKKWDDKITKELENTIYDSFHSVLYEKVGKETEPITNISKNAAECSVKMIKNQFTSYDKFLYNLENNNQITIENISKIKADCFKSSFSDFFKTK